MRILLAMSGGVDSSVVAHMLTEEGHEVIGVRFTLWTDPLAPAIAQVLPTKCCTTQNISRADKVAKKLKFPLHIVDLEKEFKTTVVDPYLEAHLRGETPNPCIGCNRNIKFGRLLELMKEYGCKKLATGHYARVWKETASDGTENYILAEAKDLRKDQSYYLYGLTQEQLSSVLFPLGDMKKADVYALAKRYDVPLPSSYRESQDLCFFPEKKPKAFLMRHLQNALKPGNIVRRDGTIVGTHDGIGLYTVGQRRGLRVGGLKIPLEVVEKDPQENRLIVADKGSEVTTSVTLQDLRFVTRTPEENVPEKFECRTRSLSAKKTGALTVRGSTAIYTFDTPTGPQSKGQSLVLYRGAEVIGGGVIV